MTTSATPLGGRELRWLEYKGCLLTHIESDVRPSEHSWNAWLSALAKSSSSKWIVCAQGDIQPSKRQWRKASRLMRDSGSTIAVMTDSRHTAALTKAASWLGIEMRAFPWQDIHEAMAFVGLEPKQRVSVRAQLTAMRDSFGPTTQDPELGSLTAADPTPSIPAPSRAPAPVVEHPLAERPMTAAASRNLVATRRTSEEIHASLERIHARLRRVAAKSDTPS